MTVSVPSVKFVFPTKRTHLTYVFHFIAVNRHRANLPLERNAANARERARMRVLSSAFSRLKTKLPGIPVDTKLSKLDTLRLATLYIQQLRANLANDDQETHDNVSMAITEQYQSLVSF